MAKRQPPPARVSLLHHSKDIKAASPIPGFPGPISFWTWRFYTHRLTPAGRWYLSACFLFLLLGSTSLELQVFVPFVYAFGIGLAAITVVFFVRPKAEISAQCAERIQAGEQLSAVLQVTNRGRRTGISWSISAFRLPPAIDPVEKEGVSLAALAPGETGTVRLHLLCHERGRFTLKGWKVQTEFPFGLLRAYVFAKQDTALLVYPQFTPLEHLDIPAGRRLQPGGVALASTLGDSFEYLGNREYREGDSIRNIDWQATARLNMPIIREYREEYFHRVAVVLDTQVSSSRGAGNDFEHAVSLCASAADWLSRQDYLVDLFAVGPDIYHLTAGRSLAYIDQMLDILACLKPSPLEAFTLLEPEIFSHLSEITTVVCVLTDWDEPRRQLAQKLHDEGVGLKIVVVRETDCTLSPHTESGSNWNIACVTPADISAGITTL